MVHQPKPARFESATGPKVAKANATEVTIKVLNADEKINPFVHCIIHFRMKRSKTDWVIDFTGNQYGFTGEPAKHLKDFEKDSMTSANDYTKLSYGFCSRTPQHKDKRISPSTRQILAFAPDCARFVNNSLYAFRHNEMSLWQLVDESESVWTEAEPRAMLFVKQAIHAWLGKMHDPMRPRLLRCPDGNSYILNVISPENDTPEIQRMTEFGAEERAAFGDVVDCTPSLLSLGFTLAQIYEFYKRGYNPKVGQGFQNLA